METETYRWHYDYTRLAWESGFSFDGNKSRKTFDRNKIALLDINRIIRERDIAIVDKHLENILDFNLDSEELRILEPSFVKLFQLCQLSVEFLMYCKKYLDKTVVILKSDLQKKEEENEFFQKELARVMAENNKFKKKIKDLKMTLNYQHQLQQSLNDQITIYQCNDCGKTFINNEYLNSHLKRRHNFTDDKITDNLNENIPLESPEGTLHASPEHEQYKMESDRLQSEIKGLKEKLNNVERRFNPNISGTLSPNHGTVKVHKSPMYIECYNDIKDLQHQFELLKTMVQSELELLKSKESDHEKYDHWMQKVFDKLEPSKITTTSTEKIQNEIQISSMDRRNSYTQTEESSEQIKDNIFVDVQNSPLKIVPSPKQRILSIQKSDDRPSSFIKVIDSPTDNVPVLPDFNLVQEEVQKKLEEKTKKDIEELGEQLSTKMSTSFNALEQRMESFWNKLNEKAALISESPSPICTRVESKSNILPIKSKPETSEKMHDEIVFDISPKTNLKIGSTESDSVSETESNRYIQSDIEIDQPETPVPKPRNAKNSQKLIDELKSKVIDRKSLYEDKESSDDHLKKHSTKTFVVTNKKTTNDGKEIKVKKLESIQKPMVKKVISKPIKMSVSETESESSTESDSESSSEEEESIKMETKQRTIKTNVGATQKVNLRARNVSLKPDKTLSREDILEDVENRLKELGVNSEWNGLPNKAYKQKTEMTSQQRNLIIKKNRSFNRTREKILEALETKVKRISNSTLSEQEPEPEREIDQKPSKFKSIMSSMKSKALLLMKPTEKLSPRSPPIYKLTIVDDKPEEIEKEITPRKPIREKEKIPVKREKIIIKPKKMYVESDSESVKSDDEYIKGKNLGQKTEISEAKNSARKSISVTSLNSELSDKSKSKSLQNIAQSISNLDSILELKKEIIAEIKKEDPKEIVQNFSSCEESISEENHLKSKQSFIGEQKHSDDDLPEYKKETVQKSVLKNYPSTSSLVKKKVIFDLESEGSKSELIIEKLPELKKTIKTNSFFDFDKDEDSTSATSSVFDGSKTNLNQLTKDKISTKAQINILAKKSEKDNSESDFDISDLL